MNEEEIAVQVEVRWQAWSGDGLEHCVARESEGGLVLSGAVVGARGTKYGAFYDVRTDALFRTREVRVTYADGAFLHVEADGEGTWRDVLGRAPLPELSGCIDVDIGVTPATNTLPVKRLDLAGGQSCDILAAYVPLPSQIGDRFTPTCAKQRYTCLEPGRKYRYEGLFRNFTAVLEVDANGLVLDYPETFRRI
ncbi:putative glycolipid-binding domain-containing protein [Roseobacter weihaiensis]|uniref:putative glycolipid-binding domain-containing protein n=1 Tax=Roseobacter weihaiensis TaxID=2763262 RepID=UPI001D0A9DAB|nr:putative glycolipid-binding domain-containing protein [Roseobacter sp. H9]